MRGARSRQLAFERHAHAFAHVTVGLPPQLEAAVAQCPHCLLLHAVGLDVEDTITQRLRELERRRLAWVGAPST